VLLALFGGSGEGLGLPPGRLLHLMALLQAATVLVVASGLLKRGAWVALIALGLLDLGASATRIQCVVPSLRLDLEARARFTPDEFAGGYLDAAELSRLEPFGYDEPEDARLGVGLGELPLGESWEEVTQMVRQDLEGRALPPHLGMRLGVRALAGKAKLPPARQVELMLPLAQRLLLEPQDALAPGGARCAWRLFTASGRWSASTAVG